MIFTSELTEKTRPPATPADFTGQSERVKTMQLPTGTSALDSATDSTSTFNTVLVTSYVRGMVSSKAYMYIIAYHQSMPFT